MSSPMMNRMFGFFSCASAGNAAYARIAAAVIAATRVLSAPNLNFVMLRYPFVVKESDLTDCGCSLLIRLIVCWLLQAHKQPVVGLAILVNERWRVAFGKV